MSLAAQPYQQLARNTVWANETLYKAVLALPEATLRASYPSFFGTLPRLLNHIYEVDLYYLDALMEGGKGRGVYLRDDIADMAELAQAQAEQDRALIGFCDDLTAEALCATRQTERKDSMAAETVGPMLLHLFQHQIHHRGQAHGMLSQAGIAPPQLDDFFLEFGRVPKAQIYWEEMRNAR